MQNTNPTICAVCGERPIIGPKETYGEYSLWECSVCRIEFWSPMKNPGSSWYAHDERYKFRNENPHRKPERNHRAFLRDAPHRGGKVLDVGMGTGNFLLGAKALGYQVFGIDFDADAVEAARQLGLGEVYAEDIAGATKRWGKESFDAVTLFEVLEHVENPLEFLRELRTLLAPDGFVGISVPSRNLPQYLKPHDLPPRHLTRWDKTSLEIILTRAGFTDIRIKVLPIPLSYLITKFHFWFKGVFSFGLVEKASGGPTVSTQNKTRRVYRLQRLARIKDYVLFSIPAFVLLLWLILIRRNGLGLYALARRS